MSDINLTLSIVTGIIALQVQLVFLVRWLVKHYLKELIPNGGQSMKDQINRLEERQYEIYKHFLDKS